MAHGTVVTFYSYKGGVGRTFLMANIATALAVWGYRVLCIDWDLEAPGLAHYFVDYIEPPRAGLVEFVEAFTADGDADWRRFALTATVPSLKGELHLIAAGGKRSDYISRVQNIRWGELYEHGFGAFLERTRTDWKSNYDFIMIDSRTGITDIGGICTAQLPDILVAALVANQQNVDGIEEVVQRARVARDRLPYDRGALQVLPLISRFDARVEYDIGQEWLSRLTSALSPLYGNWLASTVEPRVIIDRTIVPYLSIWAFGERLPVLSESSSSSPEYISYSLETLAAVIGQHLSNTALLAESRDAYVAAARRAAVQRGRFQYDLIISAPADEQKLASGLAKALTHKGVNCAVAWTDDPKSSDEVLTRSQHLLAFFDGREGDASRPEVQQFLKQAIDDKSERMIFPVLAEGTSSEQLPPLLRNHRMLLLHGDDVDAVANELENMLSLPEDRRSSSPSRPMRLATPPLSVTTSTWASTPTAFIVALTALASICCAIDLTFSQPGVRPVGAAEALLGVTGWRAAVIGVVLLTVIVYFFCLAVFRVLDRALTTPLFAYEQWVPFITNVLVMAVLYGVVFGTGAGAGAILYGLAGAVLMLLKLNEPYW